MEILTRLFTSLSGRTPLTDGEHTYNHDLGKCISIQSEKTGSLWIVYKNGKACICSNTSYVGEDGFTSQDNTQIKMFEKHSDAAKRVYMAVADWMERKQVAVPATYAFIKNSSLSEPSPLNKIKLIGGCNQSASLG